MTNSKKHNKKKHIKNMFITFIFLNQIHKVTKTPHFVTFILKIATLNNKFAISSFGEILRLSSKLISKNNNML